METRRQKLFFQKDCFQRTAEIFPPIAAVGKKKKHVCFLFYFFSRLQMAQFFFSLQIANTLIKISSCDDKTLDFDIVVLTLTL